jgi:hypothetical protein
MPLSGELPFAISAMKKPLKKHQSSGAMVQSIDWTMA